MVIRMDFTALWIGWIERVCGCGIFYRYGRNTAGRRNPLSRRLRWSGCRVWCGNILRLLSLFLWSKSGCNLSIWQGGQLLRAKNVFALFCPKTTRTHPAPNYGIASVCTLSYLHMEFYFRQCILCWVGAGFRFGLSVCLNPARPTGTGYITLPINIKDVPRVNLR